MGAGENAIVSRGELAIPEDVGGRVDAVASITGRLANFMSKHLPALGRMGTKRQVKQFRESNGANGSQFLGRPVFLLDVVGRKSGEPRPVIDECWDLLVAGYPDQGPLRDLAPKPGSDFGDAVLVPCIGNKRHE